MQRWNERDYWATAALTLVALAIRVGFVYAVPAGPAWDGILYERGAQAIARGLGYSTFMFEHRSSDTVLTAYYPVGYPAFIAVLYVVFGTSLRVLQMGGAAVSAFSVALAHRIAFRYVSGWPARLGALALALSPGQIAFASSAMTEPLFGFLLILAVYFVVRRGKALSVGDLAALVVVLAAATYVRPQAVLLAPVFPLLQDMSFAKGRKGRVLGAALATAGVLLLVAPWSARNCAALDGCAFVSTNGGSNLAIGAVPRGNGRFFFLDDRDGCAGVVGEVARDRCWRGVALSAIREHPIHWLTSAFVKLDHTLSYESFPIGYLREALHREGTVPASAVWRLSPAPTTDDSERAWRRFITAPWRILMALALLALVPIGSRRYPPAVVVSATTCACVVLTHLLFFGGDRYHLPLTPLVAVLAAGAFRGLARVYPMRARYKLHNVSATPPSFTHSDLR